MLTTELIHAPETESRRLLVVLHGLGDSLDGYRWLPSELGLPSLNYLLVNAPDPYYEGWSWFDIHHDRGGGIRRSWKLLAELLDHLRTEGWPTEQTALFGFSQGCLMTWEAGLRYPHHFAGLVGVSGWVHEHQQLLSGLSPLARQQRFLVTHGTDDPLIPFAEVKKQVEELQAAGLNVAWHVFRKAHTIAGPAELDLIRDFLTKSFPASDCSR